MVFTTTHHVRVRKVEACRHQILRGAIQIVAVRLCRLDIAYPDGEEWSTIPEHDSVISDSPGGMAHSVGCERDESVIRRGVSERICTVNLDGMHASQ